MLPPDHSLPVPTVDLIEHAGSNRAAKPRGLKTALLLLFPPSESSLRAIAPPRAHPGWRD